MTTTARRTTRRHRRVRHGLVLALAALAFVAGLAGEAPSAGAAPVATAAAAKPTAIVAMGDSFTSGEAGRWAGNSTDNCGDRQGTDKAAVAVNGCSASYARELVYLNPSIVNGCHRSKTAPILSAPLSTVGVTIDKRINLACSGAKAEHVWRASRGGSSHKGEAPQADQLAALAPTHDIKAVFLGIGGNNIGDGFGDVIGECIEDYVTSSGVFEGLENLCRDDTRTAFEPDVLAMQNKVLKSLQEIRDTMRTAGVPDANYRIVLVGYPAVLPPAALNRFGERHREYSARCPIWDEDLDYVHTQFMPKLNASMRAAAAVANNVEYLDLNEAFVGHRLCEDGTSRGPVTAPNAEWVRFFDIDVDFKGFTWPPVGLVGEQGDFNEQFHPNQFGQQAIGMCYARVLQHPSPLANPHRRCINGPTRQPSDMIISGVPKVPAVFDMTAKSIPDVGTRSAPLTVPAGSGRAAETALVHLDITHPRRGQLRVTLIDNKGRAHVLHSPSTATGPNVFFKRLLPGAAVDPAGTWTMKVEDLESGAAGTLTSWYLEFY